MTIDYSKIDYSNIKKVNINVLGKRCNLNCYFCTKHFADKNCIDHCNLKFEKFKNIELLLNTLKEHNILNLNLRGFNFDISLYGDLERFYTILVANGYRVSLETNGYIDLSHLFWFSNNTIFYNVFSLNEALSHKITGAYTIPNWDKIIPNSGKDVSILLNVCRYNEYELPDIIKYFSQFDNINSIQLKSVPMCEVNDELALDKSAYNSALRYINMFDKCTAYNDDNSLNYFSNGTKYTSCKYINKIRDKYVMVCS